MFFLKKNGIKLSFYQILKSYPSLSMLCKAPLDSKYSDIARFLSKIEPELRLLYKEINLKRIELSIKHKLKFNQKKRAFEGNMTDQRNFENEKDKYLKNNFKNIKSFKKAIKYSVFKELLTTHKFKGISGEFYYNLDWLIID